MQKKNAVRTRRKNDAMNNLTFWNREEQVGASKEPNKQGELMVWRVGTKEQVRMAEKTKRATGTYSLKSADRETSQNGRRNQGSDGHSRPGERRRRNKSEW
jgi:hypothetical protein